MVHLHELGPPVPFEPSTEQLKYMPKFNKNKVPRYLFRIHTPVTAGTTTTSYVIAPASRNGRPEARLDIFKQSPREAGVLLYSHLRGPPAYEGTCNLISWTSSLLFALQYGFHRHRGATYQSGLSKIRLLVLDTRGFPAGTFVKDIEIMKAIASTLDEGENLHGFLKFRENPTRDSREFYFGEYLSQGDLALEGRCAEATMEMLIHLGLYDLQPDLKDDERWHEWANRVLTLRVPLVALTTPPPTDRKIIRRAIVMASACFGDKFALPVALMLLTLLRRRAKDNNIVNRFVEMFTRKHQDTIPFSCVAQL